MVTFIAAFDSECVLCRTLVERGQEAMLVDEDEGQVAHAVCPPVTRLYLVRE